MKISMREIFFDNLKKSLKVSFHFHLQISRNIYLNDFPMKLPLVRKCNKPVPEIET